MDEGEIKARVESAVDKALEHASKRMVDDIMGVLREAAKQNLKGGRLNLDDRLERKGEGN